jgi:hypothetical protein
MEIFANPRKFTTRVKQETCENSRPALKPALFGDFPSGQNRDAS